MGRLEAWKLEESSESSGANLELEKRRSFKTSMLEGSLVTCFTWLEGPLDVITGVSPLKGRICVKALLAVLGRKTRRVAPRERSRVSILVGKHYREIKKVIKGRVKVEGGRKASKRRHRCKPGTKRKREKEGRKNIRPNESIESLLKSYASAKSCNLCIALQ